MQGSKLMFSDAELQMAGNSSVILTKNAIISKVYDLFGGLGRTLFTLAQPAAAAEPEIFGRLPKISRGENYAGMPWVMLDYPRCFNDKNGHFAFRVFFWWGHYFLVQWHVSGAYAAPMASQAAAGRLPLLPSGRVVYAGFPENPYEYDLNIAGMQKRDAYPGTISGTGPVLKLAIPIPLEDYPLLETVSVGLMQWGLTLAWPDINFPAGETGL